MKGRIPVFLLLCCASPVPAQPVVIHVDCVDSITLDWSGPSGTTAEFQFPHFGCFNPTGQTVTRTPGDSDNFLTPGLGNQGQPGSFPPGALPAGRPYASFNLGGNTLLAGQTVAATREFTNDAPSQPITYTPRVLAGGQGQ